MTLRSDYASGTACRQTAAVPPSLLTPGCQEVHRGRICARTAPGGYCLPPRCYCGACPWWADISAMPTYTPDSYTAFDKHAIETGQRRSTGRAP